MRNLTRREFLQSGAAGSAGLMTINASWLAQRYTVRVAVLGTGQGMVNHLAAMASLPFAEIAMIAGGSISHLKKVSATLRKQGFATPRLSTNPHEALNDPSIDAVCIAGSEIRDSALINAAVAAGKSIFLDVPPVLNDELIPQSFSGRQHVVTCLDLYRAGKIEIASSMLKSIGTLQHVSLTLEAPGTLVSNRVAQIVRTAALIEGLLAGAGEAPNTPSFVGQQGLARVVRLGDGPLLREVHIISARMRSPQRPELQISSTRGSIIVRSAARPHHGKHREKLADFLVTVVAKKWRVDETAGRAFAAMALARWICLDPSTSMIIPNGNRFGNLDQGVSL